jgi:hypothetical protein
MESCYVSFEPPYFQFGGRAIAQVVSRWFPIMVTRVRARFRSCGICGGQSGTGGRFSVSTLVSSANSFPPIAPQPPSSIIWGWYNRTIMAAVLSGLSLTPLRIIIKKKIIILLICLSSKLWVLKIIWKIINCLILYYYLYTICNDCFINIYRFMK